MNTSWAVSVLDQWNSQAHSVDEWCPDNLLIIAHPTDKVDYWLAAFILEACKKDGQYYPPNTVKNIPAAIFRHMKANLGAHNVPNMIDKKERDITTHDFTTPWMATSSSFNPWVLVCSTHEHK